MNASGPPPPAVGPAAAGASGPRPGGSIAVTGASGRLGSALLAAASRAPGPRPVAWGRPEFDLDAPARVSALLARDDPALVIHAAAWTDVDGCARDPDLAMRRNAEAVDVLARACAARGTSLVVVSTNEVFDGERIDGRGYTEDDPVAPGNPYGRSKLAGEDAARAAFGGQAGLWVVRTAWLFGPPGNDFPHRIVAIADRLPQEEALPVVVDEIGSPTFAPDLAAAILALTSATPGGLFHIANAGTVSRADWARIVLARLRPARRTRPIRRHEFMRASRPPAWAVLDCGLAAGAGVRLRPWREALMAYLGD